MPVTTVEAAVDRCLAVLEHHPSGVFSDFDGTLSAIAPTPDSARPFDGAVEAISRVHTLADQFAIITGRAATDAIAMLGLPEIRVIGNHGLEMMYLGEHTANPVGVAAIASVGRAVDEINDGLTSRIDTTGMVFENKRYTASIHYRNAPKPDVIETLLRPLAMQAANDHDLRITGGKMMFELRPKAVVNKGTALADLIDEFDLQGAIFIGDDVTDVDGFEVLHELSRTKGIHTLAVGVMSEETHPSVLEHSDILLSGVGDTVEMLAQLADRLETTRERT
jgi:trehalose 6-phosphate phosphatase